MPPEASPPTSPTGTTVWVKEDEVNSGLETRSLLDSDRPAMRVSWIRWTSDFRRTGLQVADYIVAVNGVPLTRPRDLSELQRETATGIGQYAENQRWAQAGLKEGAPLSLTVRRRLEGGEGWQELTFTAALRSPRGWRNADNRPVIGEGGPQEMERETFYDAWTSWYDKQVSEWQKVLDEGWLTGIINSRTVLKEQLEEQPRVDLLCQRYPGPFADSVRADWERVRASVAGRPYTLSAADLEYRRRGEQLAAEVANTAREARTRFLKSIEAELIPAFPTLHPIREDRSQVVGRVVELPVLRNYDWVSEAGHNYLASSGDGGTYFVDCEGPAAQRMFEAERRYEKYVDPNIRAEFAIIGRILPNPRLVVVRDSGVIGLELEPLAAMVGDAMFVDLTQVRDGLSLFAGEEALTQPPSDLPGPDASPKQIMEALIAALKAGNQKTWEALYATWRAVPLEDGRALFYPSYGRQLDSTWIDARRRIDERVYDARVVWVSDVRPVLTGKEYDGAPRVDEVLVELEHIGLFDGEYRAFIDVTVKRLWTLQRVNGGPWRIVTEAGI